MTDDWFDTEFLPDGSVKISYCGEVGFVSSSHLILPKALQLRNHVNAKKAQAHPPLP